MLHDAQSYGWAFSFTIPRFVLPHHHLLLLLEQIFPLALEMELHYVTNNILIFIFKVLFGR